MGEARKKIAAQHNIDKQLKDTIMDSKLTKDMTVGSMVAEDFNRAKTLERLGIDYCCHGSDTLETACEKQGLNADDVLAQLDGKEVQGGAPDFANWSLDLLLDYVLKKHHRNFHLHHQELMQLVEKVAKVHGSHHPELLDVRMPSQRHSRNSTAISPRRKTYSSHSFTRCMTPVLKVVKPHRSTAVPSPILSVR